MKKLLVGVEKVLHIQIVFVCCGGKSVVWSTGKRVLIGRRSKYLIEVRSRDEVIGRGGRGECFRAARSLEDVL